MTSRAWLEALADPGSLRSPGAAFDAPRPSPYLARWSIPARDDDGIQIATLECRGKSVLAAAQDSRFLGGSIGAGHAAVLERLFVHSRETRANAVVLLLASGGVRLHEANPAELALARALRALIDARAAGVPVIALCVGDVFGGASVLACAAQRTGMLPGARLGLSGPKVIATARGEQELDPADAETIMAVFGAAARAQRGQADLVADDVSKVRAWLARAIDEHEAFDVALRSRQARLDSALATLPRRADAPWAIPAGWTDALVPIDRRAGLWRVRDAHAWVVGAPADAALTPGALNALDHALMEHIADADGRADDTLVLVEDSRGHEISRAAEEICLSQFLAHHATVIGALRARHVKVRALLAGQGHSAAFFVNALQADSVVALRGARVMAMDPRAVARVTGLDQEALVACIETDPVLGHAASLLARWDGITASVAKVDAATLEQLVGA